MRSLFAAHPSGKRLLSLVLLVQLFGGSVPLALAQTASTTESMPGVEVVRTEFNPNYILDDRDIFGLGNMQLGDVQSFLESRPGILATYRTHDTDSIERSAAEIIWRVATTYQINPRYLLALLQKEQSLVDDPDPTQKQFDWATGYAICDDCSMNDPRLQEFRGFASQLEWAAKQHREKYLMQILGRGATIAGQAPGKTVTISGKTVTPVNNATAMLYSYTPHIAGNFNLWRIWQRWFSLRFPEGTIVQGKATGEMYLLRFSEKRLIKNPAIAASLIDTNKIVAVDDSRLSGYRLGPPVNFPNYSLVQTADQKRYLLVGTSKRFIQTTAFEKFGFNEDELIDVASTDIADYTDGPDITPSTTYPTGLLVKDVKKVYWYVENGIRRRIPDATFLSLYFRGRTARAWTTKQLSAVPEGKIYGLQDGELVRGKTSSAVYVIEDGQRRPIESEPDFNELGYQWKNVVTLPDAILKTYVVGPTVRPHAPIEPNEDVSSSIALSSAS